jgi:periplasmic divalent cation tolerance protein
MPEPILLLSTCANPQEAQRIAAALINDRLAACVNIIPGITSVYRWQGTVEQSSEILLLMKTTEERHKELEKRLKELHSYEVPEVVKLSISGGSAEYLTWLVEQVSANRELGLR